MHNEVDPFGICRHVCRFHGIDWQTKMKVRSLHAAPMRMCTLIHAQVKWKMTVNTFPWCLSLQMLTSILFAAVGLVGAGYSVIVSSVAINHGPLCQVGDGEWKNPFSNGWDTDTSDKDIYRIFSSWSYYTDVHLHLHLFSKTMTQRLWVQFPGNGDFTWEVLSNFFPDSSNALFSSF